MGKIVEKKKKKKKKGRPSLLDLQKRNLKEQQELQQKRQQQKRQQKKSHTNSTPLSCDNYRTATPVRRSARQNPIPDDELGEELSAEEEDDELDGKRRDKKLKLVLRLPPNQKSEPSVDSGGSDSDPVEETATANGNRKRKINAISDGSGYKGDKSISGTNQSNAFQGATKLDSGALTPLPDKKLLLFVLDRLQKKDTYGVFSDPVDPEELPDYREVIEHPMDFGTVRKKLSSGAYANLEQFEKDVFLVCSNAMQYNAPNTIYFRQARSIHELAKKNFQNLRQDSDDNNEPETKIVRRGRPPTKNLKKTIGGFSLEGLGSEFSSDPALATGGEKSALANQDLRKCSHLSDRSALPDSSGRLHGLRNNDVHASWLADNKFERNDEFTGSLVRSDTKHCKKQVVQDESRRTTYILQHPSAGVREPSVLMTFDAERKQLMPVGVLVEHGYARSLARFAANLGPVAWKVAAKKIERSLPAGTKFGPGWVGENDLPQRKLPQFPAHLPGQSLGLHRLPELPISSDNPTSCIVDPKVEISSEMPDGENFSDKHVSSCSASASKGQQNTHIPVSDFTVSLLTNKSPEPPGIRPSFPTHQSPKIRPGMNGFKGFNLSSQIGKLAGLARAPGFNAPSSQMLGNGSGTNNNVVHPESVSSFKSGETKTVTENRTNGENDSLVPTPSGFRKRPSQKQDSGLSPQQKPNSVPPDLNLRFQSSGSPSSSTVGSTQPDLALQL